MAWNPPLEFQNRKQGVPVLTAVKFIYDRAVVAEDKGVKGGKGNPKAV